MSDRPLNSSDEQPEYSGGWRAPSKPSLWRDVAKPSEESAGWRVVTALPEEIGSQPEEEGGWHLPMPEDTIYEEGQTIEMKPVTDVAPQRPEDLIADLVSQQAVDEDEEAPARPEDMVSWPELMALRSMEGGAQQTATSEMEAAEGDLSGAEKLIITQSMEAVKIDPEDAVESAEELADDDENASYMAEQIAKLQDDMAGVEDEEDEQQIGEQTAANMDFYQQQIAALQGEQTDDIASGYTPIPQGTERLDAIEPSAQAPLNPADVELAKRFRETQQAVMSLRRQYDNGLITYDQLQQRVSNYAILDNDQVWWQYGADNRQWYRYDTPSQQWVVDQPPVPLTLGAPPTETGQLDPNEVLAGSLPYLPDTQGVIEASTGQLDPYGGSGTPIPNPNQPVYDPDYTMVGATYDRDEIASAAPTIANMNPVDANATMVSPSVSGYEASDQFIERPYDDRADIAPEYSSASESPIYEDLEAERQAGLMRTVGILAGIVVALIICGLIAGGVGMMAWYNNTVSPYITAIDNLVAYEPEFLTARIMDANGDMIAELNSRDGGARDAVALTEMSPFLIHAIVSTENRTFYEDPGFDIGRVLSALLDNLSSADIVSGASTITQQVARNLVLQDTEVTADRKLREILVAMEISRRYDKNFILELYLNEIFFGNQSYGVEAASQFYFDKPASEVNMAEAALLAGLISSPAANDPVINLEQAKRATRNSLRLMLEAGCLDFQHGQWAAPGDDFCIIANQTTVDVSGTPQMLIRPNADGTYGGYVAVELARMETRTYRPRQATLRYPHFVNYVQAQIEAIFGTTDVMYQRGFTIYTTLNPRIQDVAESALERRVDQLVNNGVETGAVMVTDPQTGAIRAMVGSPDFNDESINGQFDNTRSWQQPGSAIKPFVYAAALAGLPDGRYLTPASIVWDVYTEYPVQGAPPYVPPNFNNATPQGPIPLRFALQNSINIPAVKTLEMVGLSNFQTFANNMQIQFFPDIPLSLATALGANEVRLIDMMKGYGIFANNGVYAPLYVIERITQEGAVEVPLPEREAPVQVISPQIAYLMQNILSDDASRQQQFGINTNLTLVNAGVPASGYVGAKTGTSNNGRDLWTMGFTHNAVAGVWLGTVQDTSQTVGVTGFTAASPVWNEAMRAAIQGRAPQPFSNPGGVVQITVCRETGTLADGAAVCPTRLTDIAIQGQLPPQANAGLVQTLNIDTWTGRLANQWCNEYVEQATFANIGDPWAVNWINNTAAGQQYAQLVNLPLPLQTAPTEACQQGALPTALINNPQNSQTVEGVLTITGVASGPNFSSYQLQYAPISNPTSWSDITPQITNQVTNAGTELATWDTRTVGNGQYILRLRMLSTAGGYINVDRNITIQNIQPTPTPTVPVPTVPVFPTVPTLIPGNNGGFTPVPFDDLNPTPTPTLAL